jgi:hypothetical protein
MGRKNITYRHFKCNEFEKIFGHKREEVSGQFRTLHYEEFL